MCELLRLQKISLIWGSSKKDIWNKSAYIHRNSAKTLRFIVGYIRQVCALDKSAVFFSCSHLNALSLCLFSNSFFSSPFTFVAKLRACPRSFTQSKLPSVNARFHHSNAHLRLIYHSHYYLWVNGLSSVKIKTPRLARI